MDQDVEYCTTPDGVRLAYSVIGTGRPVVRLTHWFTHLESDLSNPVMRHYALGLAYRHKLLRYDGRGLGLSQRDVADISLEAWVSDVETIVDAADFDRFVLIAASQGASIAVAYAAKHPDRVSELIIVAGYARGMLERGAGAQEVFELSRRMIRLGWGSELEAHRQWFTSRFMPDADPEQQHYFNELQRQSTSPETAERMFCAMCNVNVLALLPKVKARTLVIAYREDAVVPLEYAREIATGIPGAKFLVLDGRNHVVLPGSSAHRRLFDAISKFLGEKPIRGTLPGTASGARLLEMRAKRLQNHWAVRIAITIAAILGPLGAASWLSENFRHFLGMLVASR